MSAATASQPSVAFFGSTGGCTNACLVHTLRAGLHASALARTPAKLQKQLIAQGLSEETLSRQLTLVQGDALDKEAVKRTLKPDSDGQLVSKIVTGLGGSGRMVFNFWRPLQFVSLDNPTICASAAETLITSLQELYASNPSTAASKPLVTFISSAGVTSGPPDLPFWVRFLYGQMLAVPWADKKKMENVYGRNMTEQNAGRRVFRNIIGIRPQHLTGGESVNDGVGQDKIRSGKQQSPAIGYSVRKADVGHWMFENIVKDGAKGWEGEMVTLTN